MYFDSKYVSNTKKTWENVINIIQIDSNAILVLVVKY